MLVSLNNTLKYAEEKNIALGGFNITNLESLRSVLSAAEKLQLPGNVVYDLLTRKSRILPDYIVSSYDVLHTQSKQYVVDDIISFMKEEGVIA